MTIYNKHSLIKKIAVPVMVILAALILACTRTVPVSAAEGEKSSDTINVGGVAGGAYEVTDYEMYVTIGKDHSYDVAEKITVNIPDTLNKIEFAIPSGNFRYRGIEAEGVASTVRISAEGSSIIIEDPIALSTGIHEYVIRYKILEFADRDPGRDILYFNVLQPQWKQPIAQMTSEITFPDDFPLEDVQFYSGQYGVQDSENRLSYSVSNISHSVTIESKSIPENYSIALKAELPDGYWTGALDGVWAVFAMIPVPHLPAAEL